MPVPRFRPAARAMASLAIALCLTGPSVPAWAQSAPTAPEPAAPKTAANTLDPVAVQALTGMGNYLKSLKTFEFHSKATAEAAFADTDLLVHLDYEATYKVMRPTAFYVEIKSDRAVREYFYDGKSLTVNVPRQNYYAKVAAPPTIRQTVDKIYLDYGIDLPLADIFYWSENPVTEGITSAVRVGFARVNGKEADQFAYRGDTLDWQIWIARGKAPLPLRIVITDRSDPVRPSYSADLDWNTAPSLTAKDFAFVPPKTASAIQLAALSGGN
ncbi:DUF2092 domain-containing protein [Novosphingobium sp. TCA1]|uniref:DUF2092 domain-containing protein n=1 Tax=Novosphingobium sp. TCA1 TaxID=2682474 RepID=UPI001306278E|nr:DUF2092 domain-containing protein [Novosphingobium sp. TCA1]GFE72493.1 hypothetical protein NTCA1_01420 [Novosphingobium sp. TCA1]